MAYDDIKPAGSTSYIAEVFARDSTTGQGKTGVVYTAVTGYYQRQGASARVSIPVVDATLGAFTSGGWKELGGGWYQVGVPNLALVAGVDAVRLLFSASGMIDIQQRILLTTSDLRISTPAVAPGATNGLPLGDSAGRVLLQPTQTGVTIPTVTAVTNDVGITQAGADKVWNTAARTLSAFGFSVTVGTNNDKTGYTLTVTPPTAAAIRAEIDSNSTQLAAIVAAIAGVPAAVWASGTRTLSSFGSLVTDVVSGVWGAASRTVTLDSGERVKLHGTQPDYAPLKSSDYTAPDNSGIGVAAGAAINAASSSASAAASAASADSKGTTILSRLGAWTGSGRNTLLGAFQALFRKDADATVPGDVNADLGGGAGAGNNTTDSLEALRDRGDSGAWGGASDAAGAYTATITVVDDDTDLPLSQAQVTVRDSGGAIHHQERTDSSGEVSCPAGDDDYTVSVLGLPGYNGVANQAFAVDGADVAVEVRLSPIASGSAAPGTRIVRVITIDTAGQVAPGIPVSAILSLGSRNSVDQALIAKQVPSVESNESGIADLTCITEDQFEDGDGVYTFWWDNFKAQASVPAGDGVLNLQEHLANPPE